MLQNDKVPFHILRVTLIAALLSSFFVFAGSPTDPASATTQATVVMIARPDYGGSIVADPDGWTLYTWAGDAPAESWCYDACAVAWPPYLLSGELISPPDLPVSLGLIDRGDGTWQISLDNWPLYYFAGDAMPGDVNGDGSMGFGAQWYVNAFAPET